MRSGALDKVVYEAAGAALPTVVASPGSIRSSAGSSPLCASTRTTPAWPPASGARGCRPGRRRRIGLELRRRWPRPLDRLGRCRARRDPVTSVLHIQKVSGISPLGGHLCRCFVAARAWVDARMLVLHEGEAGAQEFAHELTDRGVPAELWRIRFDLDPKRAAAPVGRRPTIVHAPRACRPAALPAAAAARVPVRVAQHSFRQVSVVRVIAADRVAARRIARSRFGRLARYREASEGFRPGSFTVVHYGIEPGEAPPAPPEATRLQRPSGVQSDQGLRRPAQLRWRAASCRVDARDRQRRPTRSGAPRRRASRRRLLGASPRQPRCSSATRSSLLRHAGRVQAGGARRGGARRAAIVSDVGACPRSSPTARRAPSFR